MFKKDGKFYWIIYFRKSVSLNFVKFINRERERERNKEEKRKREITKERNKEREKRIKQKDWQRN